MRTAFVIAAAFAVLLLAVVAGYQWLDAAIANTLLERSRRIRPHATVAEVTKAFGPADYTFEAPNFPPWLAASAVGSVQRGTVLVYTIKQFHPKLLIIYFLPESGVAFVTWEHT